MNEAKWEKFCAKDFYANKISVTLKKDFIKIISDAFAAADFEAQKKNSKFPKKFKALIVDDIDILTSTLLEFSKSLEDFKNSTEILAHKYDWCLKNFEKYKMPYKELMITHILSFFEKESDHLHDSFSLSSLYLISSEIGLDDALSIMSVFIDKFQSEAMKLLKTYAIFPPMQKVIEKNKALEDRYSELIGACIDIALKIKKQSIFFPTMTVNSIYEKEKLDQIINQLLKNCGVFDAIDPIISEMLRKIIEASAKTFKEYYKENALKYWHELLGAVFFISEEIELINKLIQDFVKQKIFCKNTLSIKIDSLLQKKAFTFLPVIQELIRKQKISLDSEDDFIKLSTSTAFICNDYMNKILDFLIQNAHEDAIKAFLDEILTVHKKYQIVNFIQTLSTEVNEDSIKEILHRIRLK